MRWLLSATCTPARLRPPSKIGRRTSGTKLQVLLSLPNSCSNSVLPVPTLAVRLMVGNSAARAAPMLAFMARSVLSAACTSGRRSSTVEGNGTGTGVSAATSADSCRPRVCAVGNRCCGTGPPASSCSTLRSRSTWAVVLATSPRAVSTVVWFCASTSPETAPSWCMRRVSSSALTRLARVSRASCRRAWSAASVSQAVATSATRPMRTLRWFSWLCRNCCKAASFRLRTRPHRSSS